MDKAAVKPEDILREARTWLGTRFKHQGRVKRNARFQGGVDCAGVIVGVAHALGISTFDYKAYSREPLGGLLEAILAEHLDRVTGDAKPGDVLLMRFLHEPQHVGIYTGETLIHSYEAAGGCVEHRMDAIWWKRVVAVFRYRGIDG